MSHKKEEDELAKKLRNLGFRALRATPSERARDRLEDALANAESRVPRIRRQVPVFFHGTLRTHVMDEYGVLWNGPKDSPLSKHGLKEVKGTELEDLFFKLSSARINSY